MNRKKRLMSNYGLGKLMKEKNSEDEDIYDLYKILDKMLLNPQKFDLFKTRGEHDNLYDEYIEDGCDVITNQNGLHISCKLYMDENEYIQYHEYKKMYEFNYKNKEQIYVKLLEILKLDIKKRLSNDC